MTHCTHQSRWLAALTGLGLLMLLPAAHAGLTMELDLNRGNWQGYQFYQFSSYLQTNGTPPNIAFGDYFVVSPGFPTNGNASANLFRLDTNGFYQVSGNYNNFSWFDAPDFADSFIQNITNGQWSIFVTNATATNVFHFTVTANIDSNAIPLVVITNPTNGAVNVPYQPTFSWQSPSNYSEQILYGPNFGDYQPFTQTNFTGPTLNGGLNSITFDTYYLSSTGVVCSVPIDSASNAISSWVSSWHVWDYANVQFTVGTVDVSGTAHALLAHYPWDTTNADGSASGADSSGNGYNLNFRESFGSAGGTAWDFGNPAAGPGALSFWNNDGASGGVVGWNPTPTNLLTAIAGSFSLACWINTTQNLGNGGDYAYNGAGIVSAYTGGLANDLVPLALTGGQVAFNTGGEEDDTLTSNGTVNDGNYHHVVVTRNQSTGQKIIYIDGMLDDYGPGTTNLLTDAQLLTIGAVADATDPDATLANYYNGYAGLLDDLQIYSGVLSSNEVLFLFNHAGRTVQDNVADSLNVTASPQSGPVPLTVQFTCPSVDSQGNAVTNWAWDFGDGGTSTNQSPAHTYLTAGSYSPSLVAQSAGGAFPIVTGPGGIVASPTHISVSASPRSGPEPLTVLFISPTADSAGNPVTSWHWDFGDGSTSTAQNPSHTYGNLGSFSPSLVVQAGGGTYPNVIGPGPVTVFLSTTAFQTNLPGAPAYFTFNNFANASSIQVNGSAGKAATSDGRVLELTKSGAFQTGSAFSGNPLSFTYNVGFSTFFIFRLASPAGGSPGDGISFTIQSDGCFDLGSSGAGDAGITNSLSVEFDAFKPGTQTSTVGGINANQVAVKLNGTVGYWATAPVTNFLNNGNLWYAWIDYEGSSHDLEVRLAPVPVRPLAPTLQTSVNLPFVLGQTNRAAGPTQTNNLVVNGGFENEPDWGGGVASDGWFTALVGDELPGWTIEPNHAVTVHVAGGPYLTISGEYSINTDGEGYYGNNADLYQDFASTANSSYLLSFDWQSWGYISPPTSAQQEVSIADTVTGTLLFNGLYNFDGPFGPVHAVTSKFLGTGNPLRLRIQESPQSGYNDNTYILDNFSVVGSAPNHPNAYVGFTGGGANQQDILAWKFMALPTTRITGTLNLTNLPACAAVTNGMVMMAYAYDLDGITVTNYVWVPVAVGLNPGGLSTYEGDPADLSPGAIDAVVNSNAEGIDQADADINTVAITLPYSNPCGAGGQGTQGVVIGSIDDESGTDFNNVFPGYNEPDFLDELNYQLQANPPPDLVPVSVINMLNSATAPVYVTADPNGNYDYSATSFSTGVKLGTMTARLQVVDSPPVALRLLSPRTSGTNFLFNFGTVLNQNYTVWANSNLITTNWVAYTNLTGDGYVQKITVPVTNRWQNFFRLTSP